MTYLQRNKKQSHRGIKIVVVIAVLLFVLRIFGITPFAGMTQGIVQVILESKSSMLAPLKNSLVYFKSKTDLEAERDVLRAENTELKLQALTSTARTIEYQNFNAQFGQFTEGMKVFKVVLRPPFLPFDTLRIAGDMQGYTIGDHVFFSNVVIGTIVSRTNTSAHVELFSASEKITPAVIRGTQFEAKGLGDGRYRIEVAKDFEITEGDPITYPQEQLVLLGVVSQIETTEEDLFKKVYFNTPVPIASLSHVTINNAQSYEQIEPAL